MGISVFSYGRMVKKDGAVLPEYHVNDYLCSVRVVTDARGEVLERNDYSGYGNPERDYFKAEVRRDLNMFLSSSVRKPTLMGIWNILSLRLPGTNLQSLIR